MHDPAVVEPTHGYTFCDGCHQAPFCGVKFTALGDTVAEIGEWPEVPVGKLCQKGFATLQRLNHPDRLLYPLIRTTPKGEEPRFQRISWDEAYARIAEHLTRIRDEHGPDKVFFYVGDPKEPRVAVQRLAAAYGSPNYSSESWVCRRAAQMAELLTFGFSTLGNPPSPETRSLLLWGVNPAYSSPPGGFSSLLAARQRGVKIVVVDPRLTPTATMLADIHLRPRPATDGALAAGLMHVIISENLHDRAFCANWIHGFDELADYVAGYTPDRVEALTGVPAADVIAAARLFATSQPGVLMTSAQSTTHNHSPRAQPAESRRRAGRWSPRSHEQPRALPMRHRASCPGRRRRLRGSEEGRGSSLSPSRRPGRPKRSRQPPDRSQRQFVRERRERDDGRRSAIQASSPRRRMRSVC
jgi:anaerobic selenocysteine-containing dehydrogenase